MLVYDDRRIHKKDNFCCPCCINHANDGNVDEDEMVDVDGKDDENENEDEIVDDNNKKFAITSEYLLKITIVPCLSLKL